MKYNNKENIMKTDIGLGLEKWMASYMPYEWINEDLRLAVVKAMVNEWKWGLNLDTKEVEEEAENVWRTSYEEDPIVSDSLLTKELKSINDVT